MCVYPAQRTAQGAISQPGRSRFVTNGSFKEMMMPERMDEIQDTPLFAYVIASADMRYIEINERQIFLRKDPLVGYLVRGEIPGCGAGCYADLSQIFLEYTLSCEGCRDRPVAEESSAHFGQRLGRILANRLAQDSPDSPSIDRLTGALECLLNSMNVPYDLEQMENRLYYTLSYCPIRESAQATGIKRGESIAQRGFTALCESLVRDIAADWTVLKPSAIETDQPLLEIEIVRP
jgi:hypothetical protein